MTPIDWAGLPDWVTCVALDAHGQWNAFEFAPIQGEYCWEGGSRRVPLYIHTSNWRDSLTQRPEPK